MPQTNFTLILHNMSKCT